MTTSNFPKLVLDNSSLIVGGDVERREEAVNKLLDLLDELNCPVYELEGEEASGEVAYFDSDVHEIWINPDYLDSDRIVQILVHEMIHKLQFQFNWLKAQIEGDDVLIPDVEYRGSKQEWEEFLLPLGYLPEQLVEEIPAFLLMDSYEWFVAWFEAKYKDWVDYYTKLGIL